MINHETYFTVVETDSEGLPAVAMVCVDGICYFADIVYMHDDGNPPEAHVMSPEDVATVLSNN